MYYSIYIKHELWYVVCGGDGDVDRMQLDCIPRKSFKCFSRLLFIFNQVCWRAPAQSLHTSDLKCNEKWTKSKHNIIAMGTESGVNEICICDEAEDVEFFECIAQRHSVTYSFIAFIWIAGLRNESVIIMHMCFIGQGQTFHPNYNFQTKHQHFFSSSFSSYTFHSFAGEL